MREELIKKIIQNLEFGTDEFLEEVSEMLIGCREATEKVEIERGLLFSRVADTITEIADICITNESNDRVEAIGANIICDSKDSVLFILQLCTDKIILEVNGKFVLEINAQSPVLIAFKELFEQLNYSYPEYMGQA